MLEDKKDGWKAAIALAPAMIFLIVFMFFPLVNTTIMSFMEGFQFRANAGIFAISHRYQGIGFQEYINVLRDPIFLTALKKHHGYGGNICSNISNSRITCICMFE